MTGPLLGVRSMRVCGPAAEPLSSTAQRRGVGAGLGRRAFAFLPGGPVFALVAALLPQAQAQERVRIWDIALGSPIAALPSDHFVDPACGTGGGPPGLVLSGFADFARCPPEPTGLREIAFSEEDELEFIGRALRQPGIAERFRANAMFGQLVILSFLVDPDGLLQGYRIVTDSRAETAARIDAYTLAVQFKARFGNDGWSCIDLPRAAGETPIGRADFIKERCEKTSDDGAKVVIESRYYYRPGQAMVDPISGRVMQGELESSARLEVHRADALAGRAGGG